MKRTLSRMLIPKTIRSGLFLLSSLVFSTSLLAEPWINISDIYLKANIQLLADSGHIVTPVTTYPLMWHDIIRDIKSIDTDDLTPNQENAYYYISYQFKLANKNQTRIKAQAANKNNRFSSFGDTYRDKNSVQIQSSIMTDNFAAKISASYTDDPADGDQTRLDGSYVAAFLGNWVLSVGKQDRWYGPTWDTSFSLTNNARPMTALAITRNSAEPLTIPFTEFDIPWTVTSFMGKILPERLVEDLPRTLSETKNDIRF